MRLPSAIAALLTTTALLLPARALAAPAAEEGAAESGGLPQLNSETYTSQVFWLIVSFALLYFLCARLFLPRLGGIIEERRNRIADDFDQAAEFKREAEEAEIAYKQALADARAQAASIAAETRTQIDAEIREMEEETDAKLEADIAAAEKRIADTRDRATAAVREAARDTTKAIVSALIDETPSDDAVEQALTKIAGARAAPRATPATGATV